MGLFKGSEGAEAGARGHRWSQGATNFDVHRPSLVASGPIEWQAAAATMAHTKRHTQCTEHSVQEAYHLRTDASIAHGQLLSAQMIAAYMHRKYDMPLWTLADVNQSPARKELLREWASAGYGVGYVDSMPDES